VKVHVDGREIWIEFAYFSSNDEAFSAPKEITRCILRDAQAPRDSDGGLPALAWAEVVRYHKDPPNRDVARKQALAKALRALAGGDTIWLLDKARRKLFWDAYLNRKTGKVKHAK